MLQAMHFESRQRTKDRAAFTASLCRAGIAGLILCAALVWPAAALAAPPAPTHLAQIGQLGRVHLAWNSSSGATQYNVWRWDANSGWSEIADVPSTTLAYWDTTVTDGVRYRYSLRAQDAAANISDSSNIVDAYPGSDSQQPTAPSNLAQTWASGQVSLNWGASTDNVAVAQYNVWRWDVASGWGYLATVPSTKLSYSDPSVALGVHYRYSLRAQDYAGNISDSSNSVDANPLCTLYASTSGNDGNSGTLASPVATVKTMITKLQPGQTGCLMAGQTFHGDFTLRGGDSHGTAGAPVTITSSDLAQPATIDGRVVTEGGNDWLTFTHLKFNYSPTGPGLPSITIGSSHTSWTYDDIQNGNTTICINAIDDQTYGVARDTLIDHDRIHNCGPVPVTSYSAPGYYAHAIYAIGYNTTITNNYLYDNSNRGVQLRGSQGATVMHNVIDGNGSGVVFGDLGASDNEVAYNVITNSASACPTGCNSYGALAFWGDGPVGTGNSLHDNCLYGNQNGDVDVNDGGVTTANNRSADPLYVDRASKNFSLEPTSPCLGYGPDTAQP